MTHHLNLSPSVLHRFLMEVRFIVSGEAVHGKSVARHLQRHSEEALPQKRIRGQMVNLQIKSLQHLADEILTRKP